MKLLLFLALVLAKAENDLFSKLTNEIALGVGEVIDAGVGPLEKGDRNDVEYKVKLKLIKSWLAGRVPPTEKPLDESEKNSLILKLAEHVSAMLRGGDDYTFTRKIQPNVDADSVYVFAPDGMSFQLESFPK
eukprot:CAMPEP_0113848062 /NCGR_PEP_ID=MMETSP0372-20130328/2240_1 /TAXON_ID=340204 /ORGANISM="Lankesteria abbotti" /LENGTH=131 /DNA_ID=CAMNT_0000817447 /DNA_START=19 /DNA_END=414 /DNA_ORIENTATION=- /assembly_acc=CAM_ASM_000359